MPINLDALSATAAGQHGLIQRRQLRSLDVTPDRTRSLVKLGVLRPVGSRTFRLAGSPETPAQRTLAGCLDLDGWTTSTTAAALHELSAFSLRGLPHVVVRKGRRNTRSDIAHVHTSTWLPPEDLTEVHGIPTLSVARTLLSLAASAPVIGEATVRSAVEEAIRDGKARPAWIRHRLEGVRRRGRNGVALLEDILDAWDVEPTESWLEREVMGILRAAGLPLPVCQARIPAREGAVARVDFLYADLRSVIEASGYRYHRTVEQTDADAARRRRLTAAGYDVFEFTHRQLTTSPQDLVDLVTRLHRSGGRWIA